MKYEGSKDLVWHDARKCGVEGKGWEDTERYYDRLPTKAKRTVPEAVWELSHYSTGLCVNFETDSSAIFVRWSLLSDRLSMPHMPATSVSGLDLYARSSFSNWRWVGIAKPEEYAVQTACVNYGLKPGLHQYKLYLPLFNGIENLEIGVDTRAVFNPVKPRSELPLVFYGTSITQGIAASRPGMCYPAILERQMNLPVINLGFAGRGKMEIALAHLLAELEARIYVVDCLPNMEPELVERNAKNFITTLIEIQPNTPVVLVEDRTYANAWIVPALNDRNIRSRSILRQIYQDLSSKTNNLHYVPGTQLLKDNAESTVDGSHLTDLGFMQIAEVLKSTLNPLL